MVRDQKMTVSEFLTHSLQLGTTGSLTFSADQCLLEGGIRNCRLRSHQDGKRHVVSVVITIWLDIRRQLEPNLRRGMGHPRIVE